MTLEGFVFGVWLTALVAARGQPGSPDNKAPRKLSMLLRVQRFLIFEGFWIFLIWSLPLAQSNRGKWTLVLAPLIVGGAVGYWLVRKKIARTPSTS